jgi:DNA primase large subunit
MKKIGMILTLILLVVSLVGCENSASKKAIEQGKMEIANKEYDKALASFKIALDKESSNEEAKRLTTLINNYKKANDEFEKGNIDDANKIMNKIDEGTIEDSIKNDIDNLKAKINQQDKIDKEIVHIKELIKDKKYEESKKSIDKIDSDKLTNKDKKEIDELKYEIYLGLLQI